MDNFKQIIIMQKRFVCLNRRTRKLCEPDVHRKKRYSTRCTPDVYQKSPLQTYL